MEGDGREREGRGGVGRGEGKTGKVRGRVEKEGEEREREGRGWEGRLSQGKWRLLLHENNSSVFLQCTLMMSEEAIFSEFLYGP